VSVVIAPEEEEDERGTWKGLVSVVFMPDEEED